MSDTPDGLPYLLSAAAALALVYRPEEDKPNWINLHQSLRAMAFIFAGAGAGVVFATSQKSEVG